MAEENKDLFEKIGIDISSEKINIDINQTKAFFNTMKNTFEEGAKKLDQDIRDGKVDMSENIGIKVDQENINIDLAKTKNFIEEFGKKIEGFLGEIDKAVDKIDKK